MRCFDVLKLQTFNHSHSISLSSFPWWFLVLLNIGIPIWLCTLLCGTINVAFAYAPSLSQNNQGERMLGLFFLCHLIQQSSSQNLFCKQLFSLYIIRFQLAPMPTLQNVILPFVVASVDLIPRSMLL